MIAISTPMAVLCLFVSLPILAQERDKKHDELEPVVIVGGYVTPQMWKVSKGDHVMWLLNLGKPAPLGAKWHTEQLEARVAESQLVLYANPIPYSWCYGVGRTDEHYEDKLTLKAELPPETYGRWRVLKTAYFGFDDAIEKWRPSAAMNKLEDKVMETIPTPPTGPALRPLVDKAAKKYKVNVRTMPQVYRMAQFTRAEQAMVRVNSIGRSLRLRLMTRVQKATNTGSGFYICVFLRKSVRLTKIARPE
jgi:hypothetical protein